MLSKLSTLIGAVSLVAAMVAAILGRGPLWGQVVGAVMISVLLIAAVFVNASAKEAIERVDSFFKAANAEGEYPTGPIGIVSEDGENDDAGDDDAGDDDPGLH